MNTLNTVYVLDAVTKNTVFENAGDALAYGIPLSLFGFAVVFAVLILIWAILALFKVFFYTIPNSKKNKTKTENNSEVIPTPVVAASSNDNDIVAAIIAAIEAYRTANGITGGFRVVSFKKRK